MDLIDDFYTAINRRELDHCRVLVRQLQDRATTQPEFAPWCEYLTAILLGEGEHDWAAAEAIYRRLLQADPPLEPLLQGRTYLALAINLTSQARWGEAIAACEASLAVFQITPHATDPLFVWRQLATTYLIGFSYGDLSGAAAEQAIQQCQQALIAFDGLQDPPAYVDDFRSVVVNTLGEAYSILERWPEALPCFQELLAYTTNANDVLHMSMAYTYIGDAYRNLTTPRLADALENYQRAWQLIANFEGSPVQQSEVLLRLGLLHYQSGAYRSAIAYYDQAIQIYEKLRASASSEAARVGFFGSAVPTYDHKILACIACDDLVEAFNTIELVRARTLLDYLADDSPQLVQRLTGRSTTLAEVQGTLPDDALLVAYYTMGFVAARDRPRRTSGPLPLRIPQAQTLIFVISQNDITFHPSALTPNALTPRDTHQVVEAHFLQPQLRHELHKYLVAPFADKIADKRRLYLIPHGPLHLIPFQALLTADGATLLQPDGPSLVYAPSCSLLFQTSQRRRRTTPQRCLALGYNGAGPTRLRFAEAEASAVARLLGGDALVGPGAKQATLYQQARHYGILHIACHGAFDRQAPLHSALHIAAEERLTAQAIVENLKLHCELVVLSACESALTRVQRGDEFYGLLRAFTAAGALSMLATLWRVDERATVLLMDRFYTGLLAGMDPAAALQAAQVYLRSLTRHAAHDVLRQLLGDVFANDTDLLVDEADPLPFAQPKYWAAFVLFGDPSLKTVTVGQ